MWGRLVAGAGLAVPQLPKIDDNSRYMFSKYWLGACALTSAALMPAADVAPNVRVVEEIVAKVNGDIITRGELEKTRQTIEAELAKSGLKGFQLETAVREKAAD